MLTSHPEGLSFSCSSLSGPGGLERRDQQCVPLTFTALTGIKPWISHRRALMGCVNLSPNNQRRAGKELSARGRVRGARK